jgi:hypothetical protein
LKGVMPMSRFRGWLLRLERDANEDLESFELEDGSTYYYDHLETAKELFLYAYDVQLGATDKWAEPPEIFRKMCEARDPKAVLRRFEPETPQAFFDPTSVFDTEALVYERRLIPISYEPPEDLSEP